MPVAFLGFALTRARHPPPILKPGSPFHAPQIRTRCGSCSPFPKHHRSAACTAGRECALTPFLDWDGCTARALSSGSTGKRPSLAAETLRLAVGARQYWSARRSSAAKLGETRAEPVKIGPLVITDDKPTVWLPTRIGPKPYISAPYFFRQVRSQSVADKSC